MIFLAAFHATANIVKENVGVRKKKQRDYITGCESIVFNSHSSITFFNNYFCKINDNMLVLKTFFSLLKIISLFFIFNNEISHI